MSQRNTVTIPLVPPRPEVVEQAKEAGRGRSRADHRWTDEEDAFIRCNYETMTNAAIGRALGRSKTSVLRRRAGALKLGKQAASRVWTAEDDAVFRALYGRVDTGFLAGMLSRPISAVWTRAGRLKVNSRSAWSPQEDDILRTHFPCAPASEFVELLPGRSKRNIYHRAQVLSLERGLPYLLKAKNLRALVYPPELKSLIRLHHKVERKLRDVETQH